MPIEAVSVANQPPILQLGLIGFSHQQQAAIERTLLTTESSEVVWRLGPLQGSAAWWINGARTKLLMDGSIRVAPGEAGGRSVRLVLAEIDRPVAFAEPVACADLEPAITFTPSDPQAVTATLRDMESRWLGLPLARHWLAARLVACHRSLTHRVYHVLKDGELLAVIDRGGDVGIAAGVQLPDLKMSRWAGLPSSANIIPDGFHRLSWSELVWTYAVQSSIDHLPERYRSKAIFFRRAPKVAQSLLEDQHLRIMAELRGGPCSFDALESRTTMPSGALSKALGELYLAGSITVTPGRANYPQRSLARHGCRDAGNGRAWRPSGDSRQPGSVIDTARLDATVPAVLNFG